MRDYFYAAAYTVIFFECVIAFGAVMILYSK